MSVDNAKNSKVPEKPNRNGPSRCLVTSLWDFVVRQFNLLKQSIERRKCAKQLEFIDLHRHVHKK